MLKGIMRSGTIGVIVLVLLGCASPSLKDDAELENLVLELVKHNMEMGQKRVDRLNQGINRLEVKKMKEDYHISVDLDNASLEAVVRRILDETETPYLIDNTRLDGSITARFSSLPFLEALNRLLAPGEHIADMDGSLVIIRSSLEIEAAEDTSTMYKEVMLRHLDMETTNDLLGGLYPADMDGNRMVNFGRVPSSNTVFLKGSKEEVARAVRILLKADQEIAHVSLEVLVVEFNTADLEQIGSRITDLTNGEYSVSLGYGADGGLIHFSKDSSEDSGNGFTLTGVKSIVEMLVSDEKARLISRPYISTLSGTEAEIEIVSDRYVLVDDQSGGSTSEPVTSGVVLKITPTVLPDGKLRMDVYVEDSQFSSVNISNVLTEVSKNAAETVMEVNDGQTIIVGGLVLNRRAWGNTGFPWLRHIPLLNLVFAEQSRVYEEKEVSIYITPHIWEPNMLSPLIAPDAFIIDDEEGIGTDLQNLK